MRPDATPVKIRLPAISDEAVVEIYDFLCDFLRLFENHYSGQIHRFYDDRSFDNLVHRDPHSRPPDDDPPF
jgi:hypothetical protein